MMLSAENTGNCPFETRFDTGMLLDKPGYKMPQSASSKPGQGRARQRRYPPTVPGPRSASGTATAPTSRSAGPQTALASAIAS